MRRRLCGATRPTVSLVLVVLLLTDPIWAWGKKGGGSSSKTPSSSKPSSTSPKTKTQPNYPRQPTQGGTGYGGTNYGGQPNKPDPYPKGGYYPGGGTNTNQQNPGRGGGTYGGNTNQQNPGAGGYPNQQYPNQGGQNPGQGGTHYGGQPNQPYPGQGGTNYGRNPNQPYQGQGGTNYGRNPYPQYPNQGGQHPGQGGRNPNQQYPGWGQGGGYGGGQGYGGGHGYGYGHGGGYGYPNQNPNNRILSPRYGGGFAGGGYGGMGGGSPFASSVQRNGYAPSMQSKGFGKKAMLAAGVGVVAGMAVGYGIGRFPRPHFGFRSPMEEQNYNRYMYERYGAKSTDQEDYREYVYKTPPKADKSFQSYEKHMETCMKRTDLLKQEDSSSNSSPDKINLQNDQPPNNDRPKDLDTSNPQNNQSANTDGLKDPASLELNKTAPQPVSAVGTGGVDADSTPQGQSLSEKDGTASPVAGRDRRGIADSADDNVVSIAEIGYPALMDQLKSRRCMELYMVYSEKFLQKQAQQQAQAPNPNNRGDTSVRPLVLLFTTTVMLLCSNILLQ
ncbi:hypothetical protein ACEWY4_004289 [Coilia grayii]|uniref:Prion protein n=1 Tax=Coilia grayii TaxID=363190 RepID=A0ABD1KL29_9TELE